MLYKFIYIYLLSSVFYLPTVFSHISPKLEQKNEPEIQKDKNIDVNQVSEAFGHLIGKNLDSLGFDFDINKIIKGLTDSVSGIESPMTETQCVQAISFVQEDVFQKTAEKNLQDANKFLIQNANNQDIVEIEKNLLQYKIIKKGSGEKVESHDSPMICYKGKFLDGQVFGASQEDELICLEETIPGFSKGIVGMLEGEKRELFIHPTLGYGTNGYLPPNSMLIFEIELIKANSPHEKEDSLSSIPDESTREITIPDSRDSIR